MGAIHLCTLRIDGWVSLDAVGEGASVTTEEFLSPGTELWLNYVDGAVATMPPCPVPPCPVPPAAPLPGGLIVQALSAGKVVAKGSMPAGDQPRRRVVWAGGRNPLAKGDKLQLRFTLSRGVELYSWWGL